MGAGYELRPVTIDRPAGKRRAALVIMVALIGLFVLLKPWELLGASSGANGPVSRQAPAPAVASPPVAVASPTEQPSALGSLARHSGTWGVGASGLGPHNEAEPWADWTAVAPLGTSPTEPTPLGESNASCDGVANLPTDPLFIAISHDSNVPIDLHLSAWWWDGAAPVSLTDVIRQVTPSGDRGIAYLIRDDRAPWRAGRYEFHVNAGDQPLALTVCLVATP